MPVCVVRADKSRPKKEHNIILKEIIPVAIMAWRKNIWEKDKPSKNHEKPRRDETIIDSVLYDQFGWFQARVCLRFLFVIALLQQRIIEKTGINQKMKNLIKHTVKKKPTSSWTGRRVLRLQSNRPSNHWATSSTRGAWPGTTERCLWQGKLGWSRFYWSQKRRLLWSSTHCIIYWATIKNENSHYVCVNGSQWAHYRHHF